jgi:hypothetical protein
MDFAVTPAAHTSLPQPAVLGVEFHGAKSVPTEIKTNSDVDHVD